MLRCIICKTYGRSDGFVEHDNKESLNDDIR